MKRQTLMDTYEQYYKHWNVLSCIGDHPRAVKLREEREKKLQRVKKLLALTENYESAKEFLEDIQLAKKIMKEAMQVEEFI